MSVSIAQARQLPLQHRTQTHGPFLHCRFQSLKRDNCLSNGKARLASPTLLNVSIAQARQLPLQHRYWPIFRMYIQCFNRSSATIASPTLLIWQGHLNSMSVSIAQARQLPLQPLLDSSQITALLTDAFARR